MIDTFELPAAEPTNDEVTKVMAKLPKLCAGYDHVTGEPIVIRRGVEIPVHAPSLNVNEFNRKRGISEFQVQAMQCGMLFGFDAPGADPDRWQARVEKAAA